MAWTYQREEQHFDVIPEGKHRIRIRAAEKAMSKKGNDMLVLQFDVSGHTGILFNYIVFLDDKPEIKENIERRHKANLHKLRLMPKFVYKPE